jgi:hypothetical protein
MTQLFLQLRLSLPAGVVIKHNPAERTVANPDAEQQKMM